MRHHKLLRTVFLAAIFLSWPTGHAWAQAPAYPTKPINVVLPFAPGSSLEIETRLYTQKVTESTQQPFIIDYKPGAGSSIGTVYAAKAAADGYTLLVASTSLSIAAATYTPLPFDPLRDFAWIILMSKRPNFLLVHESLPIKSVAEYIAYAKTNPGKLNFGTAGGAGGSQHIAGMWLHWATQSEVTFVHYKSSGAMAPDLTSGRIQIAMSTPITAMNYIKSGKLRPIGVTTGTRTALMPDLPTIAEQGVPGYETAGWMGFAAPATTPMAVVNKLNAEFIKASKAPEIMQKLGIDGIQMVAGTPEEFRQFIANDVGRWRDFVKTSGIKISE